MPNLHLGWSTFYKKPKVCLQPAARKLQLIFHQKFDKSSKKVLIIKKVSSDVHFRRKWLSETIPIRVFQSKIYNKSPLTQTTTTTTTSTTLKALFSTVALITSTKKLMATATCTTAKTLIALLTTMALITSTTTY